MTSPESRPSSTKWTVTPVQRAPYSSASATAVAPGKAGRSAGGVLTIRRGKRSRRGGGGAWVVVDDPPREAFEKTGAHQPHEAREDDELDVALLEPVGHRRVAKISIRVIVQGEGLVRDPGFGGTLERGCVGVRRDDAGDRQPVVDQCLQVRPVSGDEDPD